MTENIVLKTEGVRDGFFIEFEGLTVEEAAYWVETIASAYEVRVTVDFESCELMYDLAA